MKLSYSDNKDVLYNLYSQYPAWLARFENDNMYLETAFNETTTLWLDNLKKIKQVKYLMIAEAPLWGEGKTYIYNPSCSKNTQFFYRSDLGGDIADKAEFIKRCNEIGLLIVDISPFVFNTVDTAVNYRKLRISDYRDLVKRTVPTFFEKKILAIRHKKSDDIKVFFRYKRVQDNFQDIVADVLIAEDFIKFPTEIGHVSKQGGGMDKVKLSKILS